MKTLRLALADLELDPLGDTITGEAWARYSREVRTTTGTTVVLAESRKPVPADGVIEWDVLPNDDPTVHADDQGFGVVVGWDLYSVKADPPRRTSLAPNRVRVSEPGRTITVTSADPALVNFATKSPATPIDPLVSYVTEGVAASTYSAKDKASLARTPLRVIASDFEETTPGSGVLRDWTTAHTGSCSHTIAASTRQDGGNTLTLVDADAAGLALVKSKAIHGYANRPQWFTTDEIVVPGTQTLAFEIGAASSRRGSIIVNNGGANTVYLNASDGLGAQAVTNVTAANGFSAARAFRLAIWYDPTIGTARFYIFYDDGAGNTRHAFMGQRVNTTVPFPITYVQFNTGQVNTGNPSFARVMGYEARGIIHGCSTDTPHNAFDMSPNKFPTQSRFNSAAGALALRLWGTLDGIVTMAHGGWTYQQMRDGDATVPAEVTATWANMVTALKPQFVLLGSGINSVSAAAQLAPPSAAATAKLAEGKQAGRDMIDAALAAGAGLVVVRNCSPVGGHVSFPTSAQLDLVDDWNAWVDTLPGIYPGRVVVSDVWTALVDPGVARTLLPRYDVGDHIHYTVAGAEALADADAAAILGR